MPRSLVRLSERDVAADNTLHEYRRAIDRRMSRDICKTSVHGDQFEVPWRIHRPRQRDAKLLKSIVDAAHPPTLRLIWRRVQVRRGSFPFRVDYASRRLLTAKVNHA